MKKLLIIMFINCTYFLNGQILVQADGILQGIGAISSENNSRTGGSESKSSSGAIQLRYGLTVAKPFTENIVGTLSIGSLSGRNWGGSDTLTYDVPSQSWLSIEPGFNYFFDEFFSGYYTGGKIAYKHGMGDASFSTIGLMARGGKMFEISERLRFGLELGIGYELGLSKEIEKISYSGPSGISWSLGVNLGFLFGDN
jgi:hypothetical protein